MRCSQSVIHALAAENAGVFREKVAPAFAESGKTPLVAFVEVDPFPADIIGKQPVESDLVVEQDVALRVVDPVDELDIVAHGHIGLSRRAVYHCKTESSVIEIADLVMKSAPDHIGKGHGA